MMYQLMIVHNQGNNDESIQQLNTGATRQMDILFLGN